MRRLLLPLLVAAVASVTPAAHAADPEIEVMQCAGDLELGVLKTPGRHETSGQLTCTLSHGSPSGYEPYRTFSSAMTGTIDNTPVAGAAYVTTAFLEFDDREHYGLHFDDVATGGLLVIANPDDHITHDSPYAYHARGFVADACFGCFSSVGGGAVIEFVAEYLYDLPVG